MYDLSSLIPIADELRFILLIMYGVYIFYLL